MLWDFKILQRRGVVSLGIIYYIIFLNYPRLSSLWIIFLKWFIKTFLHHQQYSFIINLFSSSESSVPEKSPNIPSAPPSYTPPRIFIPPAYDTEVGGGSYSMGGGW